MNHDYIDDNDEATIEDLRAIINQLKECWQLGDNRVIGEARTALLRVFRASARRLTSKR